MNETKRKTKRKKRGEKKERKEEEIRMGNDLGEPRITMVKSHCNPELHDGKPRPLIVHPKLTS